ncbi:MAG: hypothetical protein N2C14_12430, partial [Planctomycetales bacterium]
MRSESQGLQIALIMFVILTLILGVTTFLFFKKFDEEKEKKKEAVAAKKTANEDKKKAEDKVAVLKVIIGVEPGETVPNIEKFHAEDMGVSTLTGVEDEEKNYRTMIGLLDGALLSKNEELHEANIAANNLRAKIDELEGRSQILIAEANALQIKAHEAKLAQAALFTTGTK